MSQVSLREPPRSNGITVDSVGKFFFTNSLVSKGNKRLLFSCALSALGTVFPGLDGSSVTVKLSASRSADFSVSHLDFLLGYDKNVLSHSKLFMASESGVVIGRGFQQNPDSIRAGRA